MNELIKKKALLAASAVGFLPYEERSALVSHFSRAIEEAILSERIRAATVAREAARECFDNGNLNLIPTKVFDAVHAASGTS